MGKIHGGLEWLTATEAVQHLGDLLGEEVKLSQVMRQCAAGNCNVYLEPPPEGESVLIETGAWCVTGPLSSHDHHPIQHGSPATWEPGQDLVIALKGNVRQFDFARGGAALLPPEQRFGTRELVDAVWFVRLKGWQFEPRFKRREIEALAARMNHERPWGTDNELEELRAQVEKEISNREDTARQARELQERLIHETAMNAALREQIEELQRQRGDSALADIRSLLSDKDELDGLRKRAEQAEGMAAALDRQLTEQAEAKRRNDEIFDEMARQLKELHEHQRAVPTPKPNLPGLSFPYPTKQLEAMLAAALKYWADYTPDKRQPTQKEIGLDIGEALGLPRQGSGDPARKAVALASAIKPDALPDA